MEPHVTNLVLILPLALLLSSCSSISQFRSQAQSDVTTDIEIVDANINDYENQAESEAFEVEGTKDVYVDNNNISDDNIALDYSKKHYDFWLNYFTKKDHERFSRHLQNGHKFKQLVFHILKEHGLPTDLFYVGLIESGYNTKIKSSAGAAGPWQFMPKTARHYGLRVDSQVDERWNIYKSTHAAARYFSDLYNIFGSWELAMAAYNAGEYRIIRAIRKGRTRSYKVLVSKKMIPKETAYYVPKVAAARQLVQNEERFGFFHNSKDSVYGSAALVEVNESFSLKTLSKLSSVPISTLKEMNPDIKGDHIRVRGAYGLLVPKSQAQKISSVDLPTIRAPRAIASSSSKHKVRRGENLSVIARKYGISLSTLKKINNLRSSRIYIGQRLTLPGSSAQAVSTAQQTKTHRVSRGENLSVIAKKYGVSIIDIRKANKMRGSRIFPGQRLDIPGSSIVTYRVRSGDNLSKIAQRFNVSVDEIRRNNGLSNNIIYANQKLNIPTEG
ncbi:MAG: hypothetical protein COW01_11885 [Bdellovibrionales bacterium CG12_big_fil_rev_8_21_14_0_65_38_15]|nr:MAG: hypothetical protein COW79_01355 [Bdellovibrionales bacterium CG22_combo_CG10-13_8_21_14_all_38_13]PIQ54033.1 MAG: hypothetical protein COW01_11885 [Bdellovibrionales bacterium CG12_big_fil_rev_8_21_14_0_65_38_15]PIR28558.1 MAG: hypothetical protein COV38_14885 [Bdellovibrionales bacterium CG11_big_fil_rev_8_21_14_0_20_38_13]